MRKKDNVIERESIRERVFFCIRETECKRKSVYLCYRIYLRENEKKR